VYHYRLLASNGIGSVASGDGTFTTPTAPPPPSASAPPPPKPDTKGGPVSGPSLRFLGASAAAGRVRVLNGVALLLAKCPPSTPGGCTGTLTLQMTALVSTHTAASRKHHRRSRQMIVRLGRALVSIPQCTAVTVKVRLSRMAATLLADNKPLRAVAIVVARDATSAAKTTSARIVLKVVAPPHRHKHTRAG
jgi:hypothetical protein